MNKVEKIKDGIERLKKSLPWGSCASQLSMECNCKNEAYNEVLSYIDSLEEEPISNDLDSFAKEYSFNIPSDIYNLLPKEKQSSWIIEIENAVKAGALWQKKQLIDKACDWLNNFYSEDRYCYFVEEDIDNFKKAMEE